MNMKKFINGLVKEFATAQGIKSVKKVFEIAQEANAKNTKYNVLVTSVEDTLIQGEHEVKQNLNDIKNAFTTALSNEALPFNIEDVNDLSFRVVVNTSLLKESVVKRLKGIIKGDEKLLGLTEASVQIIINGIDGLDDDQMFNSYIDNDYDEVIDYPEYDTAFDDMVDNLPTDDIFADEEEVEEDEEAEGVPVIGESGSAKLVSVFDEATGEEFTIHATSVEELLTSLEATLAYSGSEESIAYELFATEESPFVVVDKNNKVSFYNDKGDFRDVIGESDFARVYVKDPKKVSVQYEDKTHDADFTIVVASLYELLQELECFLSDAQDESDAEQAFDEGSDVIAFIDKNSLATVYRDQAEQFNASDEAKNVNEDCRRFVKAVLKDRKFESVAVLRKIIVNKDNQRANRIIESLNR